MYTLLSSLDSIVNIVCDFKLELAENVEKAFSIIILIRKIRKYHLMKLAEFSV